LAFGPTAPALLDYPCKVSKDAPEQAPIQEPNCTPGVMDG